MAISVLQLYMSPVPGSSFGHLSSSSSAQCDHQLPSRSHTCFLCPTHLSCAFVPIYVTPLPSALCSRWSPICGTGDLKSNSREVQATIVQSLKGYTVLIEHCCHLSRAITFVIIWKMMLRLFVCSGRGEQMWQKANFYSIASQCFHCHPKFLLIILGFIKNYSNIAHQQESFFQLCQPVNIMFMFFGLVHLIIGLPPLPRCQQGGYAENVAIAFGKRRCVGKSDMADKFSSRTKISMETLATPKSVNEQDQSSVA